MGITEGHSFINVLYVDDEPELLEIGKIFLEKDGNFIIDTLTSADEALDSLAAKHYDAIVSDYQMPSMDGIEFLKQLKSSGDNTPFIIFTGRGREDVVIEALNNGADFYIQKGGEPKSQFAELSNKIRYAVTRRRAEESLEDVVRKLTLSQQVAHLGNWTFDIKEQKFVGSDEAARIFGYPSGYRASYQEIASQVHPDDRPVAREAFERLIKTGEPYNINFRIYRRDTGDMRFIRSKGQILKFENGQPALIFGIDIDITDQKLIEERLNRNNEELKASYDQIAATEEELRVKLEELVRQEHYWKISGEATIHPIFIMDSGQRILQCNSAVEKVFGIKADEATGKHCWEVVHRSSGPLPGCPFIRIQETLSRETMELNFNDRIHVATVDPILDDNGVLVGAVHNIRDITDFRFTEAALNESKEKFRELFNNSTDAIAIHDTEGRFLEVNDTICERLGYSREELIGKMPSDIDTPECAAAVPDLIKRVLTDHLLTFETVHITKGGRRIP